MGRKLGDPADPLLVCVRSGAKFSMPGMMETVLNIGLTDESVHGLAEQAGSERFAWDSYRRLIQMFGKTVLRHRGRAVRARARRGQAGQGHHERPRPGRRRPAARWSTRSRSIVARAHRPRLPAGPARAAGPGHPRGVRLLERRPGHPLPAPGAHPGRPGHRGQRRRDGVRQPRHGLGHRRGVHPRPGHRRSRASTATTCRTPRARTSSRASATRCRCRTWSSSTASRYDQLMDIMADAGEPLPGPVRHRVHHRARQAVDAADPGRQAHRRRPRSASPPSSSTRASSTWTRRCSRVTGAQLAQLMFPRFDAERRREADRQGHQRLARRGRRQGRLRLRHARSSGPPRASRSSWSAARPTPTTCTA